MIPPKITIFYVYSKLNLSLTLGSKLNIEQQSSSISRNFFEEMHLKIILKKVLGYYGKIIM